jgi:hypothetical protein
MATGKITLITPPDFYENSNPSILLIGLNESEQDESSQWLGQELQLDTDINLYYYQNETHIEWLLYAVARSNAVYVNADTDSPIIQTFLSYMLGKSNVYFSSVDPEKVKLFSFINGHRVNNITEFLQGVFSD